MSTANKILMGASGAGGPVGPSDDEFNRVSFLSHFDGANNGVNNAFDDGSASNHTITANGDVTQGSFGPFARPDGEWGVDMPSGPIIQNNYAGSVEVASHSDFTLSGQYTIEFFVNSTTLKNPGGASNIGLFAVGPENNANSMNLFFAGTTVRYWTSTAYNTFGSSSDIVTNSWIHVAVCRNSSNVITCFINGTALGTTFSDTTTPQGQVVIGAELYQTARYNSLVGSISNFRILNGTCLYTSDFTAPTSALTAITNTKLLTCQSNRFVDNSASAHAVTVTGAPAISSFGPFLTSAVYDPAVNGASAYLPASSYLSFAASSDFDVGTGDFTIECSLYYAEAVPSGSNYDYIWAIGANATTGIGLYVQGGIVKIWNGSNVASGSTTVNQGEWTTLSVVRSGSTLSVYQNGVRETTATVSSDITTAGNGGSIGGWINVDSNIPIAYITDFRFVNGTALRSGASYTLPTAPLTAVTNTKLLLNMADGQAIDSAAQNNLTLINDAKTSTTRAKFGDTSLYLDGSDYAIIDNSQSRAFGTGDFTVELFIWLNGSPDIYDYIFDMRNSSARSYTWALSFNYLANTSDKLMWASNTTSPTAILSADYPSLNQWVHIAVCRSGTTSRMFYDGTQVAINTSDSTDYRDTGYQGYIGCRHSIEHYIDAYMDEIRFSKMARYTSNFTAPTAAFADKGQ